MRFDTAALASLRRRRNSRGAIPSALRATDEERASKKCLRFEEFDPLAEGGHGLPEDQQIVVCSDAGLGEEGAMLGGRLTQ